MITITDKAFSQIRIVQIEENDDSSLRIFVQGGGCSVFQYDSRLTNNKQKMILSWKSMELRLL